MALKIASFILSRTPNANEQTFIGDNNDIILQIEKNVLVKKISVNAFYTSNNSNIIINNYSFLIQVLNRDRITISNNRLIIINPQNNIANLNSQLFYFNKKNPVKKINLILGGFRLLNAANFGFGFVLNNNPLINDLINYRISIYYVELL
jgi:hypothetical protein